MVKVKSRQIRLADKLANNVIGRDIDLMRLEASTRNKVLRMLNDLERDLVADLNGTAPTAVKRTLYQQKRLEALLKQTRGTIKTGYRDIKNVGAKDLKAMGKAEITWGRNLIEGGLGLPLSSVAVNQQTLTGLLNDSLIQGAPAKEWWAKQAGDTYERFKNEMRLGMLRGETIGQLTNRVLSNVTPMARHHATALTRTAFQSVAQNARLESYEPFEDVIKGYQALVTLDLKTSNICKARSNHAWDKQGNPIMGTLEPWPGPPPWHFQCRSTLLPIIKSWEELGAKGKYKEIPKSTQASMDGQVSGDLNYEDWLKGQSIENQKKALGAGRYKLWKEGKIKDFSQLIDQSGRPLLLSELASGKGISTGTSIGIAGTIADSYRKTLTGLIPEAPSSFRGFEVTSKGFTDPENLHGIAYVNPLDNKIYLNSKLFSVDGELEKVLKDANKKVNRMVDPTLRGTINHEFGHLRWLELADEKSSYKGIFSDVQKEIMKKYNSPVDFWKKLSLNAQYNQGEFLSEYYTAVKAGFKIPGEIKNIADRIIKETLGTTPEQFLKVPLSSAVGKSNYIKI